MRDVTIRPAARSDLPVVQRVLVDTWHATYDTLMGRAKEDELTASWHALPVLERQLDQAGATRLVAIEGGRIVGTAFAIRAEGYVKLDQIYVLPAAHGTGAGKALLDAVTAAAGAATPIRLEVEPRNARAIAFYKREGFAKIGEVTCCGRHSGIPADLYERPAQGGAGAQPS